MASSFMNITFTDSVKSVQSQMGSREAYRSHEQEPLQEVLIGDWEKEFIEARDSFYVGTVSESGWPYVQHRGGPVGFLKVLGERTIGFADFSGNRQYISTGNLTQDDRVSLFLMDYPHQARLKILGRARIVDAESDPALMEQLDNPHYRARVERGFVIEVEAFDWNCPKYITPRYTEAEIAARMLEANQAAAANTPAVTSAPSIIGSGDLQLVVSGVRQLTPSISAYELRVEDWGALPPVAPGAHLKVPVRLSSGTIATRQYSLTQAPGATNHYEIAVLRQHDGNGGSDALHETWRVGLRIKVEPPINHFPLHDDDRPAVLIAGGIGITPIKSMAHALDRRGVPFSLHYAARSPLEMAFRDSLERTLKDACHFYFSDSPGAARLDVAGVMQAAPANAVFYVCGPQRLIDDVLATAKALNIAPGRVQHEAFK